jgi:hypothetical protein
MLMLQEYYSALASVVLTTARDQPELRRNIYDVARSRLRNQLDWQAQDLSAIERSRRLQELEAAIERLEADLAGNRAQLPRSGAYYSGTVESIEITPPERRLPFDIAVDSQLGIKQQPRANLLPRLVLPLIIAAVLGFAGYVTVERTVRTTGTVNQADESVSVNKPDESVSRNLGGPSAGTDVPLPTAYGIYALVDSRLTELAPLPIRIPDHSNTTSGLITTASRVKFPNGNIRFVIFNRDLVRAIPEKILVRVIARITPNPSDGGKLRSTSDETGSWTIRNVSYDMRVAPVAANPAMIFVRPTSPDFVFPAGRYALVLKGVPYEFAVAGRVTDVQQCLEPNEVLNETTYTQCQHP